MKSIIYAAAAFFIFQSAWAQNSNLPKLSAGDYFNNFQLFTHESPNVDAAFFNAKKLTSDPAFEILATTLIHNVFAQEFIQRPTDNEGTLEMRAKRKTFVTQILAKMVTDSSSLMRQQVRPLFLVTKIQEAANDPQQLTRLTKEFITSEIEQKDIYRFRVGRYGLIILDVLVKHPELKSLSAELTGKLAAKLQAGQVVVTDSTSRAELDRRAWFRFLNASINFKKSEQTDDQPQKENFLKAAFTYSPDLVDKNHLNAYFYDMVLIFGEQRSGFQDEYLKIISTNTDKKQLMATLLKMALVEPSFKDNLRTVHREVMPGENFDSYWTKGIDAGASTAPPITLAVLGGKTFSSKSLSGNWILIDFWGTWCRPCREEHPALQKFYDSTIVDKPKNLSLLTIACRDIESKVNNYMTKMNYHFPVAMSDNKIEKLFNVQGYPTKILITPSGKYMTVPFGVDWVSFVNKYVEMD